MSNLIWREKLTYWLEMACWWEATARKPGNVHPQASFSDLEYRDFTRSAEIIAPLLARTQEIGIGTVILQAVEATRAVLGRNTNLGMILLLAPLAAVPQEQSLLIGVPSILKALTLEDAQQVYLAIRSAQPGGMGEVKKGDVSGEPTGTLREMMSLAADRDAIAGEYTHGYPLVLQIGLRTLQELQKVNRNADPSRKLNWEQQIILLALKLMAVQPDTLIARKTSREQAQQATSLAQAVIQTEWPHTQQGQEALRELDRFLRADGHRRNPGTTADLVAAILFAAFREGIVSPPPQCEWDRILSMFPKSPGSMPNETE